MSDKCNCNPYPGVPVPPCPPCPPKPGRPCPPPPPPFKPLPGGTQQYIGARYVPVFAEPIEWDINKPYESLTIVTYQGNSYTSKCAVPGGTEITNTRYWAKTGDYNAQVAEYRAAVGDLSTQVTGFAKDNAEFREKIDKYDKDNAAMKNEVAAATARVDDLAKRVDTAEADIDGLQATTNQHTQKLADLEAADTRLAQSIAENDTDIAALQTKDVRHDSEISAIKTVNDQQGAAIAQNTADIAQNKKNIADNAKNIAENAAELAKHANTLKEHTADLAALHRDVQDNKTAIAKNASDIVGLRADLTEAEADIAQNTDGLNHVKTDIVRIDAKDTEQDKMLDDLKHYKTVVRCVGDLITRESVTRSGAPKALKLFVQMPFSTGLLTEDATKLAAELNAANHTDFKLSGIAEPKTVTAAGATPLYVTVTGTIDGAFEVVAEENAPIFSSVNAPVTITQGVPEGYELPAGADVAIGSGSQLFPKWTSCPYFPLFFVNT